MAVWPGFLYRLTCTLIKVVPLTVTLYVPRGLGVRYEIAIR